MPIYDQNESLRHVNHGMNKVWRDVGRHRYEPTFREGPCTKATPYVPAYIKLLANAAVGELPWISTKELPAPVDALAPVPGEAKVHAIVADDSYNHVLPRPLLDIIVSVSRARVQENTWYPSPLRLAWAHERLQIGQQLLASGNLSRAAATFAEVFGTLLPGLTAPAAGQDEKSMAELSWRMLAQLVDAEVFLRWLMQALVGIMPDENTMTSVYSVSFRLSHEFRIGTDVLRLAEEIQVVERQIEQMRNSTERFVKQMRLNRFDAETYYPGDGGRVRFHGDVFTFTVTGNRRSSGLWLFDRNDGNKIKFMSFDRGVLGRLLKIMDEAGYKLGSETQDCEWYVRTPYTLNMRRRIGKGCMNPLCFRGFCCGAKVDITEAEKAAYDAEITRLFSTQSDKDQARKSYRMSRLENIHATLIRRFDEANARVELINRVEELK
jgi:hypothetical protein